MSNKRQVAELRERVARITGEVRESDLHIIHIYVVKDPVNPQNEGKVFLFKYGKKIFDKVMAAMQPEFEDETPINPFDFWQGANFKLKIRKVDGYWNYDKSEFETSAPLLRKLLQCLSFFAHSSK